MPESDWDRLLRNARVYQPDDVVDVVICAWCDDEHPLILLDNEVADCVGCGRRVQFRPDVLHAGPKTCLLCATKLMKAMKG